MATISNELAEKLKTKILNARTLKNNAQNLVKYFEDRERENQQKELNLRTRTVTRDLNENLLAGRNQQPIEKETIIAEQFKEISRLEGELAEVEVKLKNRNAFLVTEHKQEMKTCKLKIQQLQSQIERAAELRTEQIDDKSTQTDDVEHIMFVGRINEKFELGQNCEDILGTLTNENELKVNNDEEMNRLRARLDQQEQEVVCLKKKLESAENELKINAKLVKKLGNELRKSETELLISKKLANETAIREVNQLQKVEELSDELKGLLSNLTKDTAKIAEELQQKQYFSTDRCSTENTAVETTTVAENLENTSKFFHSCFD